MTLSYLPMLKTMCGKSPTKTKNALPKGRAHHGGHMPSRVLKVNVAGPSCCFDSQSSHDQTRGVFPGENRRRVLIEIPAAL
jgi:hypothetical protein